MCVGEWTFKCARRRVSVQVRTWAYVVGKYMAGKYISNQRDIPRSTFKTILSCISHYQSQISTVHIFDAFQLPLIFFVYFLVYFASPSTSSPQLADNIVRLPA